MPRPQITIILLLFVIVSASLSGVQAHIVNDETRILVNSDGSANIVQIHTFDLTNETDAALFQQLQENETAKSEFKAEFVGSLKNHAEESPNQNASAISNPQLYLFEDTDSDTGVVQTSCLWENFGNPQSNGTIILESPLSTDFSPNSKTLLAAPQQYEITTLENSHGAQNDGSSLVWDSNPDLSAIHVVMEKTDSADTDRPMPPDTPTEPTSEQSIPAFAALLVFLALLTLLLIGIRQYTR